MRDRGLVRRAQDRVTRRIRARRFRHSVRLSRKGRTSPTPDLRQMRAAMDFGTWIRNPDLGTGDPTAASLTGGWPAHGVSGGTDWWLFLQRGRTTARRRLALGELERPEEALTQLERAADPDPLSHSLASNLGVTVRGVGHRRPGEPSRRDR